MPSDISGLPSSDSPPNSQLPSHQVHNQCFQDPQDPLAPGTWHWWWWWGVEGTKDPVQRWGLLLRKEEPFWRGLSLARICILLLSLALGKLTGWPHVVPGVSGWDRPPLVSDQGCLGGVGMICDWTLSFLPVWIQFSWAATLLFCSELQSVSYLFSACFSLHFSRSMFLCSASLTLVGAGRLKCVWYAENFLRGFRHWQTEMYLMTADDSLLLHTWSSFLCQRSGPRIITTRILMR